MNKTVSIRKEQFQQNGDLNREWYLVDATDKTLGRLATEVAKILRGKKKPIYTPHVDTGDYVVVINAEKIKLTGNKLKNKVYSHHTGYPGGLKQISAANLLEKNPEKVIKNAVKGMMPKNQLNRYSLLKLNVYKGSSHPHGAQNPQPFEV